LKIISILINNRNDETSIIIFKKIYIIELSK